MQPNRNTRGYPHEGQPSGLLTERTGGSNGALKDASKRIMIGALMLILALTALGCVREPNQLVEGNALPERSAESIASTSTPTTTESDTTPTTEPDTTPMIDASPTGDALDECPVPPSGEWTGAWQSDRIDINGTATAMVQVDRTDLSGSLDLQGPADVYLVDSGTITGSVDCLDMALSVANDTLVLNGSMTPDGRSFTGTYDATLNDGAITDFGTFTLELNP